MTNKKRFSQVFNYVGENFTSKLTVETLFKLKLNDNNLEKGNNVSDFTKWIFKSLVYKPETVSTKNGLLLEEIVNKEVSPANYRTEKYFRKNYEIPHDWELEYHDLNEKNIKKYQISRLTYRDRVLYGKPDMVFRNRTNNDRIIIELKSTSGVNVDIPEDGWINMKCQLWSYSFIDEFQDSNNIFLVGDIHRIFYSENQIISNHHKSPSWWFKKTGKINLDEEGVNEFFNQCNEVFKIYGGKFV